MQWNVNVLHNSQRMSDRPTACPIANTVFLNTIDVVYHESKVLDLAYARLLDILALATRYFHILEFTSSSISTNEDYMGIGLLSSRYYRSMVLEFVQCFDLQT